MRTITIRVGALLVAALAWTGCELGAGPDQTPKTRPSSISINEITDIECYRAEIQSVEQPPQFFPQDEGATEKVVNGETKIPIEVTRGTFTITKIRLIIPENCGSVTGEIEYRGDPDFMVRGPLPFTFNEGDNETFPRHTFK